MSRIALTLVLLISLLCVSVSAQSIDNSPSRSVQLFFAAVEERDYEGARKFLPKSVIKLLEREVPGGFKGFIDSVASDNAGNKLEVHAEKIEAGKAFVDTITITASGKRVAEKWTLRLEDNLWKLDILIPR